MRLFTREELDERVLSLINLDMKEVERLTKDCRTLFLIRTESWLDVYLSEANRPLVCTQHTSSHLYSLLREHGREFMHNVFVKNKRRLLEDLLVQFGYKQIEYLEVDIHVRTEQAKMLVYLEEEVLSCWKKE